MRRCTPDESTWVRKISPISCCHCPSAPSSFSAFASIQFFDVLHCRSKPSVAASRKDPAAVCRWTSRSSHWAVISWNGDSGATICVRGLPATPAAASSAPYLAYSAPRSFHSREYEVRRLQLRSAPATTRPDRQEVEVKCSSTRVSVY